MRQSWVSVWMPSRMLWNWPAESAWLRSITQKVMASNEVAEEHLLGEKSLVQLSLLQEEAEGEA